MPSFSLPFILSTNSAVLDSAVTATVLPLRSSALLMLLSTRTIHLNCGTKKCVGKSNLLLPDRHIGGRATFDVDGAVGDEGNPGCCLHNSIEKPIGNSLSSR